MPKLWSKTIEAHRHQVRDAILDTTAGLVAERGLLGVTMSRIAEEVGISRATLYKYYPGVEEILHAWHDRQIAHHLQRLRHTAERPAEPLERLSAVLDTWAEIQGHRTDHGSEPGATELAAVLHRDDQLAPAEDQVRDLVRGVIVDAADTGEIRDDVPVDELVDFCLHALTAAAAVSDEDAMRRLVVVTLAGLRGGS